MILIMCVYSQLMSVRVVVYRFEKLVCSLHFFINPPPFPSRFRYHTPYEPRYVRVLSARAGGLFIQFRY